MDQTQNRSPKELLHQTLLFEAIGLAIFTPVTMEVTDFSSLHAFLLVAAMSVIAMSVTYAFNYAFNAVELRYWKRVASDRPWRVRVLHASLLEVCIALLTVPLILLTTEFSLWEAIAADIALMTAYAIYSFIFYAVYDFFLPVKQMPALQELTTEDWH